MIAKLRDVYNTRYLYLSFRADLSYLFSTYLNLLKNGNGVYNTNADYLAPIFEAAKRGEEVIFDLAEMKITPDCESTIQIYMEQGIKFMDSADPFRNGILEENVRRRDILKGINFVELPVFSVTDSVVEYIQSLDKTVQYKMRADNPELYSYLLYLILVLRPSVTVALTHAGTSFFKFVSSKLTYDDLAKYDEFYFVTSFGVLVVEKKNGMIPTQSRGLVSFETAMTMGSLVPTALGKQRLFEEEPWQSIARVCMNNIAGYKATRKRTLEELFS